MKVRLAIVGLVLAGTLAATAVRPAGLAAQTGTTGVITGLVRGADGQPVEGVELTMSRNGEAEGQVVSATRDGRFVSGFLTPGEYELVAERFGYVPVVVTGVEIRSGRRATLTIELRPSEPPVTEVDRVPFGAVGGEHATSAGRALTRSDLLRTPLESRDLAGALSRWSLSGRDLGARGLPGRYTALSIDGFHFEPVSHPVLGPGFLHLAALPTAFVQDAELLPQGSEVEGVETAGPLLRATTVRGQNRLEMEAHGNALGSPLGLSGLTGATLPSSYRPEGTVLVRGPIRPDTSHFAFGLQARQPPRPLSPLAASSPQSGETFLDLATGGGLPDGDGPVSRVESWSMLSGFARVDWRVGAGSAISVQTVLGLLRGEELAGGALPVVSPDAAEGRDLMVGAHLLSPLGDRGALEVRASFESSRREHGPEASDDSALPWSMVQEGGIMTGAEPGVLGSFGRSAFRFSPMVHMPLGSHRVELGVEASAYRYSEESHRTAAGGFLFPDLPAFQDRRGLRVETTAPVRDVSFNAGRLAAFVENRWTPAEDLTLSAGLRLEGEVLPWDRIDPNAGWEDRTGIDRSAERTSGAHLAPRAAVEWYPGQGTDWLVRASTGAHYGRVDPALMAEVLADSGAVRARRTLGHTGAWPAGDSPSGLSAEGRRMSLFGPQFDPPRTFASEMALVRHLDSGTTLELELGHRRTEFLPRRRDLNRTPFLTARDQFGRELYGQIGRHGDLLAVVPGSDRRFPEFEVVSALESDGWSEWWGATVGVGHRSAGPLDVEARYTFSRSRDNMPGFTTGWPVAVRGRSAAGGVEPKWVEGRSDLDSPHRLVLDAGLLVLDDPRMRLSALYGYRSGTPFTPTVRDLFDGSGPLEWRSAPPITLPAEPGASLDELRQEWDCLGELAGGTPERNACRTDPLHELNLRLGVSRSFGPGWEVELAVDGLNLLDAGPVVPDAAVLIIDGTRPIEEVGDREVRLPVEVNPGFGEPLLRLSPGRALRIGLAVRH